MGLIQEGDFVMYHYLAEKDLEKEYPKINIAMIRVDKVHDVTFEDMNEKVYEKYRASVIFREGIKGKIENSDYDERRVFKEDLEELTND